MRFKKGKIYLGENETVESFIQSFKSMKYYAICNNKFLSQEEVKDVRAYEITHLIRVGYNDFILLLKEPSEKQ